MNDVIRVVPNFVSGYKANSGFAYQEFISNKFVSKIRNKFAYCFDGFPRQSNPSVSGLFAVWNPSAIRRLVIAKWTDSVNGQMFGVSIAFSPLFKRRIVVPFLAVGNSFASVIRMMTATVFHSLPNFVKARKGISVLLKCLFSATRSAKMALHLFVGTSLECLVAPLADKFKVFTAHNDLQSLDVIYAKIGE